MRPDPTSGRGAEDVSDGSGATDFVAADAGAARPELRALPVTLFEPSAPAATGPTGPSELSSGALDGAPAGSPAELVGPLDVAATVGSGDKVGSDGSDGRLSVGVGNAVGSETGSEIGSDGTVSVGKTVGARLDRFGP